MPRLRLSRQVQGCVGQNQNLRFHPPGDGGFIIACMGPASPRWCGTTGTTTFVNNDRFIKIEVDFDASLTKNSNVPTSKQALTCPKRIWEIPEGARCRESARATAPEKIQGGNAKRLPGQKTGRVRKKRVRSKRWRSPNSAVVPLPVAEQQVNRGAASSSCRRPRSERSETGTTTGNEPSREIEAELAGKLHKGQTFDPGGAFDRGRTDRRYLRCCGSTPLRAPQEMHSGPASTPAVRAALEILLFSIGDRAMEGRDEV